MSKQKFSYIFIIQNEDTDELFAGRQIDIDSAIKEYEVNNEDLDFSVIGKIKEPIPGKPLSMDFDEKQIEWYDKQEKSPEFIKKAVNAITQLLR